MTFGIALFGIMKHHDRIIFLAFSFDVISTCTSLSLKNESQKHESADAHKQASDADSVHDPLYINSGRLRFDGRQAEFNQQVAANRTSVAVLGQ
jgi:hypothetical protein